MKKLPILSVIYCIIHVSSKKKYIGSTNNFYKRKRQHINKLNNNKHENIHLQRSWNKYGIKAFEFQILEKTTNLLTREQHYLDTSSPEFNIGLQSSGGDNISRHPNKKEIALKIGKSVRQRYQMMTPKEKQQIRDKFTGSKNPNHGNKWSKKQRKSASKRMKGKKFTKERNHKISQKLKKYWQNDSVKQQWSKKISGEGNPFFGKTHSKSTKKKISQTQKQKFQSSTPEQRYQKNSQTRKVQIDGQIYFGLSEAARQLNVCPATICHRIKSPNPKFKSYCYID